MCENNENSDLSITDKSVLELPELIKTRDYYQLLISHRGFSFRKAMADKLDKLFTPRLGFFAWKNRFLNPVKNIPKKEFKEISEAMEGALAFELNEQIDFIKNEINNLTSDIDLIETKIEGHKMILKKTEQAIEIYNNGKEKIRNNY